MAEPFLSEIRMFSFEHAPKGWALCNGQLLPINQNQALFALLGTTYGGNGQTTFALPDLRSRTPIHVGNGHTLGERAGEDAHTLSLAEMATHTHIAQATNTTPAVITQTDALLTRTDGGRRPLTPYGSAASLTALHPSSVTPTGGSQAHNNVQPSLVISFCIALQGIFPSPN